MLKGDSKRTYLRTGDLGRMYGRELTVSGRIKVLQLPDMDMHPIELTTIQEIIIIRAKKYHPEDIEGSAFEADAKGVFRPGQMVACAYETATGASLTLCKVTRLTTVLRRRGGARGGGGGARGEDASGGVGGGGEGGDGGDRTELADSGEPLRAHPASPLAQDI